METMRDLEKKQLAERTKFVQNCPHKSVLIEDYTNGHYGRTITLRCDLCQKAIVSWDGAHQADYTTPDRGRISFADGFAEDKG